ncbi:hypothetical protein B4U79_15032 [Dinothrombium tinctorium]
MLLDE